MANLQTLRRQAKNIAYNFSDAQIKVREATSNEPWGPSTSLMSEIADLSHSQVAFTEIMQMIWKRLNDAGKYWRHVYKSLVLLDYLIKTGSEKVAQQCKENIFTIETLKDFQHIEENKDQGMNVREKAKQMVALLKDDERLKNERAKAMMARRRFVQNNIGISSDGAAVGGTHPGRAKRDHHGRRNSSESAAERRRRDWRRSESELERECRPASAGEEELQLQIALAISKEEADKEVEAAKGDELRLQMAVEESRKNGGEPSLSMTSADPDADLAFGNIASGTSGAASNIDDLLSLDFGMGAAARAPAAAPPPAYQATNSDPWAPAPTSSPMGATAIGGQLPKNDPWAPVGGTAAPVKNDPWAVPVLPSGNVSTVPRAAGGVDMMMAAGSNDPWSVGGATNVAAVTTNGSTSNHVGGGGTISPLLGELADTAGVESRQRALKTPETFLGENSALVNLDNLMGPSKPATVAPSTNNPFVALTAATGGAAAASANNPFALQQRPSPTLNQMRSDQQPGINSAGTSAGDWSLPQPLQPQPTNPFM